MNETNEMWREHRAAGRAKRDRNREWSTALLELHGIAFESKNGGVHLIVKHNGRVADFWPSTGKWIVRGGDVGRGVLRLVEELEAAQ